MSASPLRWSFHLNISFELRYPSLWEEEEPAKKQQHSSQWADSAALAFPGWERTIFFILDSSTRFFFSPCAYFIVLGSLAVLLLPAKEEIGRDKPTSAAGDWPNFSQPRNGELRWVGNVSSVTSTVIINIPAWVMPDLRRTFTIFDLLAVTRQQTKMVSNAAVAEAVPSGISPANRHWPAGLADGSEGWPQGVVFDSFDWREIRCQKTLRRCGMSHVNSKAGN